MSGLSIQKSANDIQKFSDLIAQIPKFCKYLSSCSFKKALVIMSPITLGIRPDLSVDDNSRSPFVVLALVENMFVDFTYLEAEIKRPTESLSHIYAQVLVDLELLRQYFVLQIRTASLMGRKKGSKLIQMQDAVQHVRKLCIMISMRIALIAAYVQMKKSGECEIDYECRNALLRSCNMACGLLQDPTLPDTLICLFQLVDCLYYVGEGMYRESVVTLSQCKYYINRFAQLMGAKPLRTTDTVRDDHGLALVHIEPRVISWLKLVCTHRQEILSLVFMTQRVGPVRAMLKEISNGLPRSEGSVESIIQEVKKRASSQSNTADVVGADSGVEDAKPRNSSSLEAEVSKLLSSTREHYGRISLLLVRLPDGADQMRGGTATSSRRCSDFPETVGMINFRCPPLRTWDAHNAPNGHCWEDGCDNKVPSGICGSGVSNPAIAFPGAGARKNEDSDINTKNLPCTVLHPPPFGFLFGSSESSLHPSFQTNNTAATGAVNGADTPNYKQKALYSWQNDTNRNRSPRGVLSECMVYLRFEDGTDSFARTRDEMFSKSNVPLHVMLSLLCLDHMQFIGDDIARRLQILNPLSIPTRVDVEDLPTEARYQDWLMDHWDEIAEVISENMLFRSKCLDLSNKRVVNSAKVSVKQKVAHPLQVDRLQGRILQGNMDRLAALRDTSESVLEHSKKAPSHIILQESMFSPSRQTYNSTVKANFCVGDESLNESLCDTKGMLSGSFRWILVCDGFVGNACSFAAANEAIKLSFKQFSEKVRGSSVTDTLQ